MAFPKIVAFLLAGALSLPTSVFPQIKGSKAEDPCWDHVNNRLVGLLPIGFVTAFISRLYRKSSDQARNEKGFKPGSGGWILLGPYEKIGSFVMVGVSGIALYRWYSCGE